MKIYIVLSLVFAAYTNSVTAQLDSVGKKYYAYAHFYTNVDDENTEYISSVFCWVFAPTKNAKGYPGDYLNKWAISNFKEQLPQEKIKDCTCRFQIDSTGQFYSAAEALRLWTLESKDCSVQNIAVVIVNFPACIEK
jgi:hypothetical protein